jgi:hypothetical protein
MSVIVMVLVSSFLQAGDPGTLKLTIREKASAGDGPPVPARVHLTGPDGKPVRAAGLPFFHDHLNCDGSLNIEVPPGAYRYTVERGPEYRRVSGAVEVANGTASRAVVLERWIDLKEKGWWSGETHVHRPLGDMPLLLRSEDLHIAPVLTVWNQTDLWRGTALPPKLIEEPEPGRFYHVLACEDERQGGAVLYFNLTKPLDFKGDGREFPSPVRRLTEAADRDSAWAEIEKPFWWDVPAWVATGKVKSIEIANNHMCRSTVYENEAWGRPRDPARLPPPRGNGFYTQEIYYRLLGCGFRIPPSAGSASGVLPNPVGYNRVYVQLDGPLRWEEWWKGLAAGRSFVTNGPILLVKANQRHPGEVFRSPEGSPLRIEIDIQAGGNDPFESVEVIRDGEVAERLEVAVAPGGDPLTSFHPRPLEFTRSGWFLVRAIARVPETFRFASTAPFYVEIGGKPRTIHRGDVEYFLRWIDERIAQIELSKDIRSPEEREEVLGPQRKAQEVFRGLLQQAD